MLKKISLFFVGAGMMTNMVCAQTTENTATAAAPKTLHTLWGNVAPSVNTLGLYVAPEFQYVGAAGAYAPAMGLSGMFVVNQKLALGVTASHSRNFTPTDLNNAGLRMNYGFGGAQIEYTFAPHSLVHVSVPLVIGAGMARVDSLRNGPRFNDQNHQRNDFNRGFNRNDPFFVVQPGLRVEANLSRFAKLYAGANYRIATGSSNVTYPTGSTTSTLSNSQLSGLNFNVGLKLGWFDYQVKHKARS